MSSTNLLFERPDVSLPKGVNAAVTTRVGGASTGVFAALNLALHVGDDEKVVSENRALLRSRLDLPGEPCWLNQVHSNHIALSGDADGSYTNLPGEVLCIQTADCLPILLWDDSGLEIAAVHAGWQGLEAAVIANAVSKFAGTSISAWIGPHIQQCHYEVDIKLFEKFSAYTQAFTEGQDEAHWQLSLAAIATLQLNEAGVDQVYCSSSCTACDEERFFSYRRDGQCGRMASLIWRAFS